MDERTTLDLFRLNGRVALITGGSKGLGKEMALALAEAGAVTVVCSRSGSDCESVATEIAAKTGRESLGLAADVTVDAAVTRLMQAVTDRFGRLDVLVNCAGINIRHPLDRFPVDEFRQVIEINLTGSWLCCRAAGPIMTS
ncbi:MAG: SDR family NAD(P)-dependent oxidoreductase, partial [Candidatus Latescibacteria bacterium]|nr:SDR family NAD(P)-dependent oxidoreductase [Candidatus Latescibacterota bacterium]